MPYLRSCAVRVLAVGAAFVLATFGFSQTARTSALTSFKVSGKEFVVRGSNLAKVEIQYFPSGTGIEQPGILGQARRMTPSGGNELWRLPLPAKAELLIVELFAVGFDEKGTVVGRKSLPYGGATAISKGLYGSGNWYQINQTEAGKHFTYSKGESFDVVLWPMKKYPPAELSITCTPVDALRIVPNVPNIFGTVTTFRFEGIHKGSCTLRNQEFSVSVDIQ